MIRLCIVLGALTLAGQAGAQGPDSAGPVLTLSDAQQIAKHNNPVYLQSVVARRSASANLRAAYGQFLPQVGANFFAQYSQSGTPVSITSASSGFSVQ